MASFRLRQDLKRARLDGFALPLGIVPRGLRAPAVGYTVTYAPGEDDEPDTYSFYVTVSHERVAAILRRAFSLLPKAVYAVVEISSRDAYRAMDVYVGSELIDRRRFLAVWRECEPVLLEDGTLGAGANSDEPYVEVFLDQWKGIWVIVPPSMRDDVDALLRSFELEEVAETWPPEGEDEGSTDSETRPVLADDGADVDDVLMHLKDEWLLELNVDRDANLDDGGRNLGMTLWHALVGVADPINGSVEDADVSIWATAGSLNDAELLIDSALSDWRVAEIYTIDRVAYDERPDELADLSPRRERAEIHLVQIEPRRMRPHGTAHG